MSIGYRYRDGMGVEKDCSEAIKYYEYAALLTLQHLESYGFLFHVDNIKLEEMDRLLESGSRIFRDADQDVIDYYLHLTDTGDATSHTILGTLYLSGGLYIDQDLDKAAYHFSKAAEVEDPTALSILAFMHALGNPLPFDPDLAFQLATRAIEAPKGGMEGVPYAALGFMHWQGLGTKQNIREAESYFNKATSKNNVDSLYYLGMIKLKENPFEERVKRLKGDESPIRGSRIPNLRSNSRSGEAEQALNMLTVASANGHPSAAFMLGHMSKIGLGMSRPNCRKAVTFFKTVAENGPWMLDMNKARRMYIEGKYDESVRLYSTLAYAGVETAQANVGHMLIGRRYCMDMNEKKCEHRGLGMFRRSANQGNVQSNIKIGDYHYYKEGGDNEENYKKAATFYTIAADDNYHQAVFNLGILHHFGLGVQRDAHLAKRYYDQAVSLYPDAKLPSNIMLAVMKLQTYSGFYYLLIFSLFFCPIFFIFL